jgi:hypothetical protein
VADQIELVGSGIVSLPAAPGRAARAAVRPRAELVRERDEPLARAHVARVQQPALVFERRPSASRSRQTVRFGGVSDACTWRTARSAPADRAAGRAVLAALQRRQAARCCFVPEISAPFDAYAFFIAMRTV